MRINDTVTFVEDGFDEDIEFGDEISDDDEDDVDNVSFGKTLELLYIYAISFKKLGVLLFFLHLFQYMHAYDISCPYRSDDPQCNNKK